MDGIAVVSAAIPPDDEDDYSDMPPLEGDVTEDDDMPSLCDVKGSRGVPREPLCDFLIHHGAAFDAALARECHRGTAARGVWKLPNGDVTRLRGRKLPATLLSPDFDLGAWYELLLGEDCYG